MDSGDGAVTRKISRDDVISKFKDEGDFDRLRLKIIRKLKENDELRNSIVSAVKQSVALNRPGAENMKPRQLSDSIHHEIGEKVMSQISDGIWDIIRSGDDMKNEINETVQSVYSRLVNPQGSQGGEPSSNTDAVALQNRADNGPPVLATSDKINASLSDCEPDEPPGFALHALHRDDSNDKQVKEEPQDKLPIEKQMGEAQHSEQLFNKDAVNLTTGPAVSTTEEQKHPCDGSDEDLDLPPGFG